MKNIYIVSSPFQCISAIEAKTQFNLKNNILIAIYHQKDSDEIAIQMRETFNLCEWDEIIEIGLKKTKSKYVEYIAAIKKLQNQKYNNFFIGNFGQFPTILMSNLDIKKIYAIDDGMGTVNLHENELNPNVQQKIKFFKFVKLLRYIIMGLSTSFDKHRINYFTMFDLKAINNEEIIKNRFLFMQEYALKKKIDENTIYFLGQAMVEDGWVSSDNYFIFLQKIKDYFKNKNFDIIYIPHRREKELEKLELLADSHFKIEKLSMPIELFFLRAETLPQEICSFLSTALYSIEKIFKIKTTAFYIKKEKLLSMHDSIEKRYDELKIGGVKIVDYLD